MLKAKRQTMEETRALGAPGSSREGVIHDDIEHTYAASLGSDTFARADVSGAISQAKAPASTLKRRGRNAFENTS